ncbi:MAG: 7-carboxy-7-deazaguanine synthase QueE [Candidatus Chlorobium antarcticum]|jgi:7-carboxy-7-deazaguanine synthase|nr:7-carboxy-7-deazaguanine synthase QueE [Candidatus Chlorobium antarcticum]
MNDTRLNISEIFRSIQGESSYAGWPCTFIRLAGCSHNCRHCDSLYAKITEERLTTKEVLTRALALKTDIIEITGGEPLEQAESHSLMTELCNTGRKVLLETGGFMPVAGIDPRVHKIIDLKPPSSGHEKDNCMENITLALKAGERMRKSFEFKLVLADRNDYLWARDLLGQNPLQESCTVLMGVVAGTLSPDRLAGWILEDSLRIRMQLQLHKLIWPERTRGA